VPAKEMKKGKLMQMQQGQQRRQQCLQKK